MTLRNFVAYVEKNAKKNKDLPGRGTNRLELLFTSYVDMGGQFPLDDQACKDVITRAIDEYFYIKTQRTFRGYMGGCKK